MTPIYLQDRRHAVKRTRLLLTWLTVGALLLVGAVRAKAQTTITLQPGQTRIITVKAAPAPVVKPETVTVTKIVTVTKCYDAALQPITCPTTPPPVVTPPIDTTPTPIPPTPADSTSHEPAGMQTLTERPFAARNENGWTDINSGGGSMSIVSTPSGPTSPGTTGAILYARGCCAGGAPTDNNVGWSARPRTLYLALTMMLSSNFSGHAESGVNKLIYAYAPTSSSDHFYLAAMGSGMSALQPQVRWEGGAGNVNYTPNVKAATLSRGAWHRFEVVAVGNTSGNQDGSLDMYLDGALIGHYTGIRFNSGATTWSRLLQGSNYGGNNSTPPADQFLYLDHLRVSGK